MNLITKKFLFAVCILYHIVLQAQPVAYPLKANLPHNDDYTVRVREPNGEWLDLFEYKVDVDMDHVQQASMAQFDMSGPVEVMVRKNNGSIDDVCIRPRRHQIAYTQNGNVITFMLKEPQYLSIEFNGDRLHNLHLFANPTEKETYTESNDSVMYFGPGIHRPDDLPNNQIRIPSNTTVYLAPGAVVQAKLLIDKSENVRILGRGILDHPIRGIEVTDSKNILIDGITVINPDHYSIFGGGSTGLVIKNFKTFSCKGWSDGIDLMCCRNVDISNVFLRNSDDCIALYNHRWNWWGGSSDITIKNAVLWADIAHPINMGGHGDPESTEGEILENVHVSYIDILEHDEDDRNYQGCMSIDCGDKNIVRHVTFDHIWVDDFQEGRLFNLHILFNPKYNKAPGGRIEDITFSHINYNGVGANPSVICGYDEEHAIKNIRFKNVTINKKRLSSLDGFITNEHISNITFE